MAIIKTDEMQEAIVDDLIRADRKKNGITRKDEEYPVYLSDSLERIDERRGELSIEQMFDSAQLSFKKADPAMIKSAQEALWVRDALSVRTALVDVDLTELQFAVARRKVFGDSDEEIARELHCTQQNVNLHWERACLRLYNRLKLSPRAAIIAVLVEEFGAEDVRAAGCM